MAKQRKAWMTTLGKKFQARSSRFNKNRTGSQSERPDRAGLETQARSAAAKRRALQLRHGHRSEVEQELFLFLLDVCVFALGPNAVSPTFETKFARIEPLGDGKFTLSFMRHNDKWVALYDGISVDECMKAIQDDPWFVP